MRVGEPSAFAEGFSVCVTRRGLRPVPSAFAEGSRFVLLGAAFGPPAVDFMLAAVTFGPPANGLVHGRCARRLRSIGGANARTGVR